MFEIFLTNLILINKKKLLTSKTNPWEKSKGAGSRVARGIKLVLKTNIKEFFFFDHHVIPKTEKIKFSKIIF